MPREVLWAPWRMAYVAGEAPGKGECIFCALPERPEARESLVLRADERAVVLLNRFPYNSGHLMVAPRRHVARLAALEAAEYASLMQVVREAASVVEQAFSPEGMNVGVNLGAAAGAGIADHLHWHLVPRWNGDTNFMPVVADVKVLPQHLLSTWDLLHPLFA